MVIRLLATDVLTWYILSVCAFAQPGNAKPRFEVASIRSISRDDLVAKRGQGGFSGLTISGKRVDIGGFQMSALISTAFRLNPRLIVGVPLARDTLFAIEAIMPDGATRDQLPDMLGALLEDRFHLRTHFQAIDQDGYALVAGKGPLHLNKPREIDVSKCSPWTDNPSIPGSKLCVDRTFERSIFAYTDSEWGPMETVSSRGTIRDEYFRIPMTVLAQSLATHLSNQGGNPDYSYYLPVADRTGISGEWDVVLERADPMAMGREARQLYDPLDAYSSALANVGLRLQKTSVRIDKLFVDHVDKLPTEN